MKRGKPVHNELPDRYLVLPYSIEFHIQGFNLPCFYPSGTRVFALRQGLDCDEWFNNFVREIIGRIGKDFFPVCRLSDGEFLFLFGDQPPFGVMSFKDRLKYRLTYIKNKWFSSSFHAFTGTLYSSGRYSTRERRSVYDDYVKGLKFISKKGVLALHLSYNIKIPFQEKYFPALKHWLEENQIHLNESNYYQFYFVYALFASRHRLELFKDRIVLVVHGATGVKKDAIINGLLREGVARVFWCGISQERSLFDIINVDKFIGRIDFCLVGAGIGKVNIFRQLEPLNVPCIDAGYFFEIWASPDRKWNRVYCFHEDDYFNNPTASRFLGLSISE
jgi:hypothetical protein